MSATSLSLSFDGGTIVARGGEPSVTATLPHVRFDARTSVYRAEARYFRAIVEHLRANHIEYVDEARAYQPMEWTLHGEREPFPHQVEGLNAWWNAGGRGIVVLPTGTGKTFLAMLAIRRAKRPTLVITPTIDLLNQWHHQLSDGFGVPVGAVGGGNYDFQPITVSTYDSAHLYVERWGNKYGLLVFDECHHLPGPSYMLAAIGSLAPYRLGLTATLERADGQEAVLPSLIGPEVYRREIHELSGDFLAEYRSQCVFVDLSPEEKAAYQRNRDIYRAFLSSRGIAVGSAAGWQRFVWESSRTAEGRAAFRAYRESKRLERAASAKLAKLAELLETHRHERVLVFTADNATVYQIARQFLVPAITHQTRAKERRQILKHLHAGEYSVVVTSQVLNEGVDVPSAGVGIVLSGTGTVRENVQRLGRLLRKHGDKQAILYEVVARGTAEEYTSERRRQHTAFR